MERYKITRFEQYKTDVEQCVQSNNDRMSSVVVVDLKLWKNSKPTKASFSGWWTARGNYLVPATMYIFVQKPIEQTRFFVMRTWHGCVSDLVDAGTRFRRRDHGNRQVYPAATRGAHSTWECFFFSKIKTNCDNEFRATALATTTLSRINWIFTLMNRIYRGRLNYNGASVCVRINSRTAVGRDARLTYVRVRI